MPIDLSGDAATPKLPQPSSADAPASTWLSQVKTMATTAAAAAPRPSYDPNAVADARAKLNALLKLSEPGTAEEGTFGVAGGRLAEYVTPEGGVGGAEALYQADVTSARTALDEALRARREQALAKPGEEPRPDNAAPKPGNIAKQTEPMTWDEYNALTPLQRNAVDYNTSLVRAVRRDRKMQDEYAGGDQQAIYDKITEKLGASGSQQHMAYDKVVTRLFGEGADSKWYAPETVALLQQLDLKDPQATLDDFLSLDAAITTKDLRHLTDFTPPPLVRGESVQTDREDMVRQIAVSNSNLEEKLTKGNDMLQSMRATMIRDRNEYVSNLGGIPKAAPTMLGYGSPTQIDTEGRTVTTMDGHFQRAFDLLARKEGDRETLLAQLAAGAEPGQMEAFMRYVDARSRNGEQYGIDLGGTEGQKYLTPEEFRVKMGLEKKEGSDG